MPMSPRQRANVALLLRRARSRFTVDVALLSRDGGAERPTYPIVTGQHMGGAA